MGGYADEHDFGFLRIQLKKVNVANHCQSGASDAMQMSHYKITIIIIIIIIIIINIIIIIIIIIIIDCICALPQISELIGYAMAGEGREETCVICLLMEG